MRYIRTAVTEHFKILAIWWLLYVIHALSPICFSFAFKIERFDLSGARGRPLARRALRTDLSQHFSCLAIASFV
jgi:hypothetical protein